MDDTQEDRLTRLEYAIWGLRGDNGLLSEVRGLRLELQNYRENEANRRALEIQERKKDFRWRVGTVIAIVSAILVAAGIVAGALG